MKKVTIYSTPTCHFCILAEDFFNDHGIDYTKYDVASDIAKRKEMVEKSGQMGVPVIDIDGQILVGFNQSAVAKVLGIQA